MLTDFDDVSSILKQISFLKYTWGWYIFKGFYLICKLIVVINQTLRSNKSVSIVIDLNYRLRWNDYFVNVLIKVNF